VNFARLTRRFLGVYSQSVSEQKTTTPLFGIVVAGNADQYTYTEHHYDKQSLTFLSIYQ
jgi:hypothetical protein